MKLIVGLGNPGSVYARNRHNVGFHCVNLLAKRHDIVMDRRQCLSRVGRGKIGGVDAVLAKPATFVNLSGEAVVRLVRKYGVTTGDLLVIYDDLDMPLGKLRLRPDGSSGGHKGMTSIISELGSQDFPRLKIGIGRPVSNDGTLLSDEESIVGYVLSNFIPEEERIIKPAIARAAEAVHCMLTEGIVAAMNSFN